MKAARKTPNLMAQWKLGIQRLLDLLETDGPLTNVQICERLGTEVGATRTRLCRLATMGYVYSTRIQGQRFTNVALYHFGPGGDEKEESDMKQRTIHSWQPSAFKIDPITAALFGPAHKN